MQNRKFLLQASKMMHYCKFNIYKNQVKKIIKLKIEMLKFIDVSCYLFLQKSVETCYFLAFCFIRFVMRTVIIGQLEKLLHILYFIVFLYISFIEIVTGVPLGLPRKSKISERGASTFLVGSVAADAAFVLRAFGLLFFEIRKKRVEIFGFFFFGSWFNFHYKTHLLKKELKFGYTINNNLQKF